MASQFEFHLIGGEAPEGALDADQLIALITSLRNVALKIGRLETDAKTVGQTPARVQQATKLWIGLAQGSTTILAQRVSAGDGTVDHESSDEQAFDGKFQELVDSIAIDRRPAWVDTPLSRAAEGLTAALQQAAPTVEFRVDGIIRHTFKTNTVHRATWRTPVKQQAVDTVTFVGRLYSVNLNTNRLQVQDDVGHRVALPNVTNALEIAQLIGSHVVVAGIPEFDAATSRIVRIRRATIKAADPLNKSDIGGVISLDEILSSAPGIELNAPGIDISDEEFDAFMEVIHR